jgi:hypothetical protein
MNTATTWIKTASSDTEIQFTSDTTFGGSKVAKASLVDGKINWSTDDVPHFVIERAHQHFGL